MILDYNSRGYFTLHMAHGEADPREVMGTHGLNYSETASRGRGEHVLFTKEPHAAVAFWQYGTPSAKANLLQLHTNIEASWNVSKDRHNHSIQIPNDKELWPFQCSSIQYALTAFRPGVGLFNRG